MPHVHNRRPPHEYFMAMFPPDALIRIVTLTSEKLREKGKQVTTGGDSSKFVGILILGTRYEFGSRNGRASGDIMLTSACQIMLLLIANLRTAARSRTRHAGGAA
jgi:hypothetical protein